MSFQLIEDFQNLAQESVDNQPAANGHIWQTRGVLSSKEFVVSPVAEKTALSCDPRKRGRALLRLRNPMPSGSSGTLFFRIRYGGDPQGASWIGLTGKPEALTSFGGATMSYQTDAGPKVSAAEHSKKYIFDIHTWYSVWMVFDLADQSGFQIDNSYQIYYRRDGDDENSIQQMFDESGGHDFRLELSESRQTLEAFMIGGTAIAPFYVTDLYLDSSGKNLNDPLDATTLTLASSTEKYTIVFQSTKDNWTNRTAKQAAWILQEYIYKSTGQKLDSYDLSAPVGPFPSKCILVGDSCTVRQLNPEINFSKMPPEQYLVRVRGDHLILAGADRPGDPWDWNYVTLMISTPTLHAVSRFLEMFIDARWYLPGKIPVISDANMGTKWFGEEWTDLKASGLSVPRSLNLMDAPTSSIRDLRLITSTGYWSTAATDPALGGWVDPTNNNKPDTTFMQEMTTGAARWLRLNRIGLFEPVWQTHYMGYVMPKAWHSTPDKKLIPAESKYFAFYDPALEGTDAAYDPTSGRVRGGMNETFVPLPKPSLAAFPQKPYFVPDKNHICVSGRKDSPNNEEPVEGVGEDNPEIYQLIHDRLLDLVNVNFLRSIPICPNDYLYCHCACDPCLAKDIGSQAVPPDTSELSTHRNIGDRMFGFFNRVAKDLARSIDVWVTTYAYDDYVLPYELKLKGNHSKFLAPNLVVYDVQNGYGAFFHDAFPDGDPHTNTREARQYRISRWGTTTLDGGTGRLALFCQPFFIGTFDPWVNQTMLVDRDAFVDLIGRTAFYGYMGGYFALGRMGLDKGEGVGFWRDRYLLARLLDNGRPLNDEPRAIRLEGYLKQVSERADQILDDYYHGLFGPGDTFVREADKAITKALDQFIAGSTNDMNVYGAIKTKWNDETLFQQVFKPVRSDVNYYLDLATTATNASSDPRPAAHLELVKKGWEFNSLTIDLWDRLHVYVTNKSLEPNQKYSEDQFAAARSLGETMVARVNLVSEVNNPNKYRNLCGLVVWPAMFSEAEGEDGRQPAGLTHTLGETRKRILTVLKMQNDNDKPDSQGYKWPLGIYPETLLQPPGKYFSGSPASVFVDHFISDDKLTSYFVLINEYRTPQSFVLTLVGVPAGSKPAMVDETNDLNGPSIDPVANQDQYQYKVSAAVGTMVLRLTGVKFT